MGEQAYSPVMLLWCGILLLFAVPRVSGVTIRGEPELSFDNGTMATLPCTFQSNNTVSPQIAVTWSYKHSGGSFQTLMYYSGGVSYTGNIPQFKDRVSWAGNLDKGDASISIAGVQFADNGTFSCSVKNPPDVDGVPSEIKVHIVDRGSPPSSTGEVWIITAGILTGVVLIIVIIAFVIYRKKKKDKMNYHGCSASDTLMPHPVPLPRRLRPDTERLVQGIRPGPQGPIIYAQLDHSGMTGSSTVVRKDAVVYADIRTP